MEAATNCLWCLQFCEDMRYLLIFVQCVTCRATWILLTLVWRSATVLNKSKPFHIICNSSQFAVGFCYRPVCWGLGWLQFFHGILPFRILSWKPALYWNCLVGCCTLIVSCVFQSLYIGNVLWCCTLRISCGFNLTRNSSMCTCTCKQPVVCRDN